MTRYPGHSNDAPAHGITLPDGRRLCYEEYGDPAGFPVFYFHGSPGSRLEGRLADDAARRQHVRIIAPERPGYGGSDFQPGRRFDHWPNDVAALADVLGIDQFAAIGLSGGGPHVLACAAAMPRRVVAAAVVSGAGPIDAYHARSKSAIGRFFRKATMPIVRVVIKGGVRLLPWAIKRKSAKDLNTYADRKILGRLEERERFRTDLLEALRPGARGVVHEFDLHTRAWPFALDDVHTTIHLWHGDADTIVPIDIGRYVAAHLPRCQPRFLTGEGHLLIVDHIVEVLADAPLSRAIEHNGTGAPTNSPGRRLTSTHSPDVQTPERGLSSKRLSPTQYSGPVPTNANQRLATSDRRPTTDDRRPTTNDRRPTTDDQSPITNHQSPITNHQSPITNHQSPITNHQKKPS